MFKSRSLSETSKNQLVLVSEPANRKAALKQVQKVHAKAIEEWMDARNFNGNMNTQNFR